jgi:hypothetical protein
MRWALVAAGAVVCCLAGCGRSDAGAVERYCSVVRSTHDQATVAYEQNNSGTPRSETAVPAIIAARSAAAPPEVSSEWLAIVAGPAMESDGNDGGKKQADYDFASSTIDAYNVEHCGVAPDLALPTSVNVR